MKKKCVNKKYGLYWKGKENCILDAKKSSDKQFYPSKEKSVNFNTTENIYIEGDNIDALKLLQKDFKNKIRVIYIDPPYNTGKNFVYKDDYQHSDWCTMIYPRLLLAKDLLSDDGVIFISIDDNEICNLKNICEEIFGEENFITQFIYEKTQHFGRQKLNAYSNAEYILCYAKALNDKKIKELLVENIKTELEDAPLYNASNNTKILTFPIGSVKFKIKDGKYSKTASPDYELINTVDIKSGKNINEFSIKFKSRWSQNKVNAEIQKGTTFLIKSEKFAIRALYGKNKFSTVAPKQIIFTNKTNKFCTKSRFGKHVTTNETATKELKNLISGADFSYPKPVSLISYLLSLIYDYKNDMFDNNYTVLDFFSGSGTTAHAVMELNAIDGGKRKFILIQNPENVKKDSDAYKSGFKTLCDIGEERIKRAVVNIKEGYPSSNVDYGFRVYTIHN